jgi:hypothetical protein
LIGGIATSNPTTKDTDVLENSTGGVLSVPDHIPSLDVVRCPFFGPPFDTHNRIPKIAQTLSPMPLSISNITTLLPPATDHSNVTIRKKAIPCNPKIPLGATEGGLAQFSELSLVLLDLDCTQKTIFPDSLDLIPNKVSLPTLRESQLTSLVTL